MPRRRVFSLLLAVALPAGAAEISFSYRNHAIFSSQEETGVPRSNVLMHENNLQGDYSRYRLGVNFSNQLGAAGDNQPVRLEKKFARAEFGDWEIIGGDSYQELGRGIALSLYRDPVFGLDTTLEGGSVRYQPEWGTYSLFGGRLNAFKTPVAINPQETSLIDNEIRLIGGSANGKVGEETKLGGHYFYAAVRPFDSPDFLSDYHTLGATIHRENLGDWDIYAESNVLYSQLLEEGSPTLPLGYGSYGAVSWAPSPWKAKLEVKDYRDYNFEFRRPPTLEEDIIESANTTNATASRLAVEHRNLETKTTYLASYLLGNDRIYDGTFHHGVVGSRFKGPFDFDMEARAGYRTMPGKNNLAHAALKVKAKTFTGQTAEVGYRKQYENQNLNTSPSVVDRNIFDFTYTFSENFNLSVGYEYMPRLSEATGNHFFNGGGVVKVGSFASRVFVGKTSGGTVCSGGVCRLVPPYTGAYLETHLSL